MTLEEFNLLSEEEKCENYKLLSNRDKYIVRITSPIVVQVIKEGSLTLTDAEQETLKDLKIYSDELNKKTPSSR